MVTLKLSRWQEKKEDAAWARILVEKIKQAGTVQIIEDVIYGAHCSRGKIKNWLLNKGIQDIRFKTVLSQQTAQVLGNHKTFREYFQGKHPECDVRILGIAGEQSWMAIARMTQCMADYMDYIAERVCG